MASYTISSDAKYSDATYADDDIITITNQATFTVDTDTVNLARLLIPSTNKGGTLLLKNASNTTPIFVKINDRIAASGTPDCLFKAEGEFIQIGTGDGSTKTFNLPQNSLGENYDDLGGLWVDHGETFRNGEAYYRNYAQVVDETLLLDVERVSDVFSQNTTTNTVTFKNAPPVGAAIFVPNIQVKLGSTPVASPSIAVSHLARADLSKISFGKNLSHSFNQNSGWKFNYVAIAETGSSTVGATASTGIIDIKNSILKTSEFRLDGCSLAFSLKNVTSIGKDLNANKVRSIYSAGGYIEKLTVICDTNLANVVTSNVLMSFNSNNDVTIYDSVAAGQVGSGLNLNSSSNVTLINCKFLPHAHTSILGIANINNMIAIAASSNLYFKNIEQIETGDTYQAVHFNISAASTNITVDGFIGVISSDTNNMVVNNSNNLRMNNVTIKSVDGTLTSNRLVTNTASSSNLIFSNWRLDPSVTERLAPNNYAYEFRGNATIDRVPLLNSREYISNSQGGFPVGFSGDDTTSIHYIDGTNVSSTSGLMVVNFVNETTTKTDYLSTNVLGNYYIDSLGSLYMDTLMDTITIQSDVFYGITGVNGFGMRGRAGVLTEDFVKLYYDGLHDGVTTFYAGDGINHIDLYNSVEPYYFNGGVSVRRPNGTWSNYVRMMGQSIKGNFTPSNFYQIGDVITQTLTNGVSLTGTVWDIVRGSSSTQEAVLIKNIQASDGTLTTFSVTENINGTSTIVNTRNGYSPVISNITAATAQFPDPDAATALNEIISNLTNVTDNPLQFKFKIARVAGLNTEETGTPSYAVYINAVYVNTQIEDYTVPFISSPVTISGPNITDGSRVQLYNETTDVELANFVLNPENSEQTITTGFSTTFDLESNDVNIGDVIKLRVTCQTGLEALLPLEEIGVVTSGGIVFPQAQQPDTIYNANNIDGSAITGITVTPDYTNIQIDVDDNEAPYEITAQQIYNFYAYIITTAQGIANFYGAISPIDRMNYRINSSVVALKIQNTGTTDVVINGGRLYRDDNVSIIDTNPATGAGTGSLVHDTGFLLQYIQPQVESAVSTIESDVASIKKKANLIPALV